MSVLALASPASLKGVLTPASAAAHLATGLRRWVTAEELPVADGGEGTAAVLHAARGGEWREAMVSDPLGRPVLARWLVLPDGSAVVDSAKRWAYLFWPRASAIRSAPHARARRAPPRRARAGSRARFSSASAAPRRSTAASRCGRSPVRLCATCEYASCAMCATHCSANAERRASSARRRAPTRVRSRSSSTDSPRSPSWSRIASCRGRCRRRPWRGVCGARRRALRRCGSRPRHDRLRRSCAARRSRCHR